MVPGTARIVIIGGGVLGTSAAFQLAAAGHQDIVLLDRGPLAGGTTPFAAGQTAYLPAQKHLLPFTTYCIKFFENFAAHTGYAIDFHQHGSIRIALTEQHVPGLHARVEAAASLGDTVEWLTPQQARELVPTLNVPDAKGMLLMPRDGYVEPRSVAAAYAAAARDRGVTICTRTPVTGVDIGEGAVRAVRTAVGTIRAQWVVVAAGAWTRQFCQHLGLNIRTVPVRHQALVTAPLPAVRASQPVVRIVEPQVYVRPEAGGLLVGGYGYRPLSFDMHAFPEHFEIPDLEADQNLLPPVGRRGSPLLPGSADGWSDPGAAGITNHHARRSAPRFRRGAGAGVDYSVGLSGGWHLGLARARADCGRHCLRPGESPDCRLQG